MARRRISTLICGFALFAIFLIAFAVPSSIPTRLSNPSRSGGHGFHIPPSLNPWKSQLNPFKAPAHPPPRQDNDTDGESSWYSNYLGLVMPFSSSVTLDESRSLLPPYQKRAPIYCYYDSTLTKNKEKKDAESELLLTWRRAWWSQGFRPVILSEAEAISHPYYQRLRLVTQDKEVSPEMKNDVMRWLAFENMKGGILAHHLVFPMARHDDPLLVFLRRGEYPHLTRWENFGDALFVGSREHVYTAITELIDNSDLATNDDIVSALPDDAFAVEPSHNAFAFYNQEVLARYGTIAEETGAVKIDKLNRVINGHLHVSFQNFFREGGINVLKPKPLHSSELTAPALQLALSLALCPDTPIPQSCPPNMPKCTPCSAETPIKIFTGSKFSTERNVYTIGTVPHPLTFGLVDTMREDIDIPYIRREMKRDQWLEETINSTGIHQLISFKEAVAKDSNLGSSIWLEAEKGNPSSSSSESLATALEEQVDLDWYFGFRVPQSKADVASANIEGEMASAEARQKEARVISIAKRMGKSKDPTDRRIIEAVEAWNMQDAEAWRFARAFRAREEVERRKFEKDEAKYVGGAGSEQEEKRGWLG